MRKLLYTLLALVAIVATIIFLFPGAKTTESDVVTIASGKLTGMTLESSGTTYFKGVPYAAAPVGDKRWAPPEEPEPWEGIRQTHDYGPACIQQTDGQSDFIVLMADGAGLASWKGKLFAFLARLLTGTVTSEDCLTLTIWKPAEISEPLPVMVWYHGGGHRFGAGDADAYKGELLVQKGVILVSINYRLGIFGYFSHPELSAESPLGISGNYGTLDQIHALRWVQENIAAFGGDPSRVTIFGESAGAHSVGQVMASPLSESLVHGAIAQSGIGTHQFRTLKPSKHFPESAEMVGERFAVALRIEGQDQLAQLRARDANEINDLFMEGQRNPIWDALSHPVVDGHVFPKSVAEIFTANEHQPVPLMIGTNADEGTLLAPLVGSPFAERQLPSQSLEAYEDLIRAEYGEKADQVLALYPAEDEDTLFAAINDLFGDHFFGMQAWFTADAMARNGNPAYLYFFTRTSPSPDEWAGAYHGADLQFVFGNFFPLFPKNDYDDALSDQMMTYWAQFARTGNPNGAGGPEWTLFDPEDPHELELGATVAMRPVEREENYRLLLTNQYSLLDALTPEPELTETSDEEPAMEGNAK